MENISINDGFVNIMKGLGTQKDPRENTNFFTPSILIHQALASHLYSSNWIAGKAVDIPINDALKKWRKLIIQDSKKKKEVEKTFQKAKIKQKISSLLKWARVYGGAVIIAIIDDDDPEKPLQVEKIKKGSLKNIIVLDQYFVYPETINRNILSENYGQPEHYTVAREGQKIHHTRIHKAIGQQATLDQLEINNFWGESLFKKLFDPLKDSGVISQAISTLMYEASVDVFKIKDLNFNVASGDDELIQKRLEIVNQMKSFVNAVVLDADDDFQKKPTQFTALKEIDMQFIHKVCAATDIPVTRFMGTSPDGMNATGKSDSDNYFDMIESIQENDIAPILDFLDPIIMMNSFGKYDGLEYEFNPLRQKTPMEKTDIELKQAQKDQIYMDYDVISPLDVQKNLCENRSYISIDYERIEELQKLHEEEEKEIEYIEEEEE